MVPKLHHTSVRIPTYSYVFIKFLQYVGIREYVGIRMNAQEYVEIRIHAYVFLRIPTYSYVFLQYIGIREYVGLRMNTYQYVRIHIHAYVLIPEDVQRIRKMFKGFGICSKDSERCSKDSEDHKKIRKLSAMNSTSFTKRGLHKSPVDTNDRSKKLVETTNIF